VNRLTRRGGHYGRFDGSGNGGSVGTVKIALTCCEFAEAFLVFGTEICNKFVDGFIGGQVHMPQVAAMPG